MDKDKDYRPDQNEPEKITPASAALLVAALAGTGIAVGFGLSDMENGNAVKMVADAAAATVGGRVVIDGIETFIGPLIKKL